jgi:hypothetical protein
MAPRSIISQIASCPLGRSARRYIASVRGGQTVASGSRTAFRAPVHALWCWSSASTSTTNGPASIRINCGPCGSSRAPRDADRLCGALRTSATYDSNEVGCEVIGQCRSLLAISPSCDGLADDIRGRQLLSPCDSRNSLASFGVKAQREGR